MLQNTPLQASPEVQDLSLRKGNFLIVGWWAWAAGWGRIYTTGLTIMGLQFYESYLNGVAHFQYFGGQKIQVGKDLKIERFTPH